MWTLPWRNDDNKMGSCTDSLRFAVTHFPFCGFFMCQTRSQKDLSTMMNEVFSTDIVC